MSVKLRGKSHNKRPNPTHRRVTGYLQLTLEH